MFFPIEKLDRSRKYTYTTQVGIIWCYAYSGETSEAVHYGRDGITRGTSSRRSHERTERLREREQLGFGASRLPSELSVSCSVGENQQEEVGPCFGF